MNFYELLYAGKNSGALSATYYELLFAKYLNPGGGDEWATYDGTLPAQYTANGDYLADYRIYGAAGGVGDKTVNLFDKDITEGIEDNCYISKTTGNKVSDAQYYISAPITVISEETYYWVFHITSGGAFHTAPTVGFFDANDNQIGVAPHGSGVKYFPFTTPANCAYIKASVYKMDLNEAMLTKGSTAPASYVPYGYEVDMVVSDSITATTTQIYIGSDPLEADEYVDYGGDKIYRKTDNLIPVPEVRKLTDGELTVEVTDEGEWRYTVSNVTQESRECIFDVTPFTFPQGTSWGGDGVFKLWYGNGSRRISISFLGDDGSEDIWIPKGNGDNIYHALAHDGEFLCTKIKILAEYGQTPISGFLRPMLVNTGIDPQTFVPHVEPEDPPVPLPALPTIDGVNIVDYVGQSVAPSRFYAKYKKG